MGLQQYKKKRHFNRTTEPKGKESIAKRRPLSFVVHKHAARRLHYDLRLEMDGLLKSWAVPKGPSLDPNEKRLAVNVEDHPLEYCEFEGTIPEGEYGAGKVLIWDRGQWFPAGQPEEGYRKGSLKFRLEGEKLRGNWALVRMHGAAAGENNENWLLIKEKDEDAKPLSKGDILKEKPASVKTGESLDESAKKKSSRSEKRKAIPRKLVKSAGERKSGRPVSFELSKLPGSRKSPFPSDITPQLCTLVTAPPQGEDWAHEIKLDGYRVLCELRKGGVKLFTRRGNDWATRFSSVAQAAKNLPTSEALLDGEVVMVEEDGTTSFQALQNALDIKRGEDLIYYAFDLLYLDGYDLRATPLLKRKEILKNLINAAGHNSIRYGDHVLGKGDLFYEQACKVGLEGIVSKRIDSPYRSIRGSDWLKIKCLKRQEFVIGGFTDPRGTRTGFGALLLGFYEGKELIFAGRVGTGFNERFLKELRLKLDRMEQAESPFANPPTGSETRGVHWVRPKLVGEVAFREWTHEGILRQPSFQGLREDKSPLEVVREKPHPISRANKESQMKTSTHYEPETIYRKKKEKVEVGGVSLTNPDRILYPEQGITKLELAQYFYDVADWIMPHLADRPLMIRRCPEGHQKDCFYQKHANESTPTAIGHVMIRDEENKEYPFLYVDTMEGLISLAQMGALEIHAWGARRDSVEKPDQITFDLDPDPSVPWPRVVQAAKDMHQILDTIGLTGFLKTSGGKGLHIVVPIARRHDWEEVKDFSRAVAEILASQSPSDFILEASKIRRKNRIFIDYFRNGRGATAIVPYSPRALSGAPVATPIEWSELNDKLKPDAFKLKDISDRLSKLKQDPWEEMPEARASITSQMKKAVGL